MAETRFEGRSPVGRYWLSKCEGFAVTGGERGVVEELIRFARQRLAAYKCPQQVRFVGALPRNAMGKVQRSELAR